MARILTLDPEKARGLRRLVARMIARQFGGELPGVMKILLADFQVAISTNWLVYHLHERKRSPMSKLQREMVATVVNGLVGGAP